MKTANTATNTDQTGQQFEQQPEDFDGDPHREKHRTITRYADDAYYAVRAINHATITRTPIPAPVVYDVLGALKQLGHALDQALGQISTGLAASLEAPSLYEVYEADGSDPAQSVAAARAALNIACGAARDLGGDLEHAQNQLTWQGYRPATSTTVGDER